MDTVLLSSFLTQYDAVKASFKEMKPFLNINAEAESYYYRSIFLTKILFLLYAFGMAIRKRFPAILSHSRNFCGTLQNPVLREIFPSLLPVFGILVFYRGPLTSVSAEFLTDIFTLIFSLNYAIEAYKKEFQKVSCIIFVVLFVHWYINHTASTGKFRFSAYFQILALLFLSCLPMMPTNSKYRHRLAYLYILMGIWVFYKLDEHYDGHRYVMHQNKTRGATEEKRQTKIELERGKLEDVLRNMDVNEESSKTLPVTFKNHYTERYQPSVFSIGIETKMKTEDAVFKLPEAADAVKSSTSDVSCSADSKFREEEKLRNEFETAQNKEMDAQSDKTYLEEVPKSKLESTSEAKNKEKGVTGIDSESADGNGKVIVTDKASGIDVVTFKGVPSAEGNGKVTKTDKISEIDIVSFKSVPSEGSVKATNADKVSDINVTFKSVPSEGNGKVTNADKVSDIDVTFKSVPSAEGNGRVTETDKVSEVDIGSFKSVKSEGNGKVTKTDKISDIDVITSKDFTTANKRDGTSDSSDANFKPKGKIILNGERTVPILKRQGEISKVATNEIKAKVFRSRKVETKDAAIRKGLHSKNESLAIFGSGKQATAGGIIAKSVRLNYRKVNPVKIERKKGTELQVKNSKANQGGRFIKPVKIHLSGKLDKKKNLLAIGDDNPSKEPEKTE